MTSLVGKRATKVVVGRGTAGNRGGKDRAAVGADGRGGGAGDGEVAVAEEAAGEVLEIDVEGVVSALAESGLHGGLALVVVPGTVGGASDLDEVEGDAGGGVVGVQDIKLSPS
jgi:hypothetical protein